MWFRTKEGKLIQINKLDFLNDSDYLESIYRTLVGFRPKTKHIPEIQRLKNLLDS